MLAGYSLQMAFANSGATVQLVTSSLNAERSFFERRGPSRRFYLTSQLQKCLLARSNVYNEKRSKMEGDRLGSWPFREWVAIFAIVLNFLGLCTMHWDGAIGNPNTLACLKRHIFVIFLALRVQDERHNQPAIR